MNNKLPTLITPAGLTRWVCVNKPSVKFNPDGVYSVELLLPPEIAEPIIADFKKQAEAAKEKAIKDTPKNAGKIRTYGLHVPGEKAFDKDGNETGDYVFKFKGNAKIKPKNGDPFEKRPGVFDAKGKPLPAGVIVGRGSRVKVAYQAVPFCADGLKKAGVSLRLSAVQVLELVQPSGGGSAESFGFGEEEGYEAAEGETMPTETPGGTPTGNGGADF